MITWMEAARAVQVLIGLAQCAWSSVVLRGATCAVVLPLFFHPPPSWCGRISLSKPLRGSKPAMTSKPAAIGFLHDNQQAAEAAAALE